MSDPIHSTGFESSPDPSLPHNRSPENCRSSDVRIGRVQEPGSPAVRTPSPENREAVPGGVLTQQQLDELRALASRFVRTSAEADDIAQDAALASMSRSDPPTRPWFAGVLKNKAADYVRRDRSRRMREIARGPRDATPCPADLAELRELRERVRQELSALPEELRLPLLAHYVDGSSTQRIADQLRVTRDSVKKRLQRGRAELGRRLSRSLGEDGPRALMLLPLLRGRDRIGDVSASSKPAAPAVRRPHRLLGGALGIAAFGLVWLDSEGRPDLSPTSLAATPPEIESGRAETCSLAAHASRTPLTLGASLQESSAYPELTLVDAHGFPLAPTSVLWRDIPAPLGYLRQRCAGLPVDAPLSTIAQSLHSTDERGRLVGRAPSGAESLGGTWHVSDPTYSAIGVHRAGSGRMWLVAQPDWRIEGRIVGPTERGRAGIEIWSSTPVTLPNGEGTTLLWSPVGRSRPEGYFGPLRVPAAVGSTLEFRDGGTCKARLPLDLEPTDALHVRLAEHPDLGAGFQGQLIGHDGAPVAGAVLSWSQRRTKTGVDGFFSVKLRGSSPPSALLVQLQSGLELRLEPDPGGPGLPATILRLPELPGPSAAQVRDPFGRSVEGLLVLEIASPAARRSAGHGLEHPTPGPSRATTDSQGRFELSRRERGPADLALLDPATFRVELHEEVWADSNHEQLVWNPRETERGHELHLVGGNGAPLAGVRATLALTPDNSRSRTRDSVFGPHTTSDANGWVDLGSYGRRHVSIVLRVDEASTRAYRWIWPDELDGEAPTRIELDLQHRVRVRAPRAPGRASVEFIDAAGFRVPVHAELTGAQRWATTHELPDRSGELHFWVPERAVSCRLTLGDSALAERPVSFEDANLECVEF